MCAPLLQYNRTHPGYPGPLLDRPDDDILRSMQHSSVVWVPGLPFKGSLLFQESRALHALLPPPGLLSHLCRCPVFHPHQNSFPGPPSLPFSLAPTLDDYTRGSNSHLMPKAPTPVSWA